MTHYYLAFAALTTTLAVISYVQGRTFPFVVNAVCALVNLAEFFYWYK